MTAWQIERLETCDSTQDEASTRARDGAADGTVVVATRMEDGRGQHGRGWHAPEGGLYLSVVLRELDDPRLLTLALGNAVADVLEVAGVEPGMKWVNDILIGDKKVAGILAEAESTGSRIEFIVAGIGININGHVADWPHPLHDIAITLQDALGAEACIEDLETFLFERLDHWITAVREGRGSEVVAAWRARDALSGRVVGFDPEGDFCVKVLGKAAGIDDAGRLRIETDDGVQTFDSGSVFLQG